MTSQAVERLNKRLDVEMESLESQFGNIVRASSLRDAGADVDKAKTKDKYKVTQESQQIEGAAANITHSSHALVSLTSEVKQALLLNDFKTLNFGMKHRHGTLKHEGNESTSTLIKIKDDMTRVREELEDVLYSSKYIYPSASKFT
ncbi:surfeit locus protein 5 subunit 22 of mediator complex-domain-containing protein [Chytridium lagenaria]|nr:surfeit locus protein 5 subunit 22 of mediator complex-domain-containing protein [Chytridium lagenaria]